MLINPPATIKDLGGKGYQLSLLAGFCPVPEFFVIRFDSTDETNNTGIQAEILKAFDSHMFSLVSVRSSATVEDSNSASFAGMFETKLNVSREGLIQAVQEVVSSLKDERVVEYCRLNNQKYEQIEMRIVIQKMLNSRVSGVCITREKEGSETLLIEACFGLGEAIVSGLVTPDTYKVNRHSFEIVSSTVGFQKIMFELDTYQAPIPVPFFQRNAKKLQDCELIELSRTFIYVEEKFGYKSADIEWAYEGNALYILQVRPFVGML